MDNFIQCITPSGNKKNRTKIIPFVVMAEK